jgi:hypothetical protein
MTTEPNSADLAAERDFILGQWRQTLVDLIFAESGLRMTRKIAEQEADDRMAQALAARPYDFEAVRQKYADLEMVKVIFRQLADALEEPEP